NPPEIPNFFPRTPPEPGKPRLVITEQPKQRGMRFRYECEGRSAGSILGENSTEGSRTLPSIEVRTGKTPGKHREILGNTWSGAGWDFGVDLGSTSWGKTAPRAAGPCPASR
uniref:RHD domain-containing protein n=1 Tax=Catharus ustulatus TaxID=91951 RepID=A0A8C3UVD9_CATUS